jgi:DNA mismatch endonuclease, patch repair protein
MMSGIGAKDTKPELALRRALHARGFRYRLHDKRLPGKPDIVLPRYKAVIFVHGCFWHRHPNCRYATTPATRPEFWAKKFRGNVERDKRNQVALTDLGWRVAVVWECDLRTPQLANTASSLTAWLQGGQRHWTYQ